MKTTTLILILAACMTAGCSGGGGGGGSAAATASPQLIADPAVTPTPIPTPAPTPAPTPDPSQGSTVTITTYALATTKAPVSGWSTKTYTATGTCMTYLAKTYCWDDGVKTLAWVDIANHNYGPYTYTYWGLQNNPAQAGSYETCSGGCVSDYMSNPQYVDSNLGTNLTAAAINNVFSHGISSQVNCTESAGVLTCGSLVITL